jgi:hypothetical protein
MRLRDTTAAVSCLKPDEEDEITNADINLVPINKALNSIDHGHDVPFVTIMLICIYRDSITMLMLLFYI